MKVLVTGSNGFIGKNLCQHLSEIEGMEIIYFDKEDDFSVIENNINEINFIFHLAGVNRPKDIKEFYVGNTNLTKNIIDLLYKKSLRIPILISSSIQAELENDYGISKKQAEDIIIGYGKKCKSYIYRLHNVFGKWCRPNYNSVIATFCYNISHNLDITINDPNVELSLVYIDDVIKEFIKVLETGESTKKVNYYSYIEPIYKYKLNDIVSLIKGFKNNMESIYIPETGNDFIKKLFSTYLSYVELEDMVINLKMNVDGRGSFTELIKTNSCGQVSVSISKPGVFRGNHYHHTKMERFIVIKGKAKIMFRHMISNEIKEYYVDDQAFKIVNIPVGYTHRIENIGDNDMILLLWCNEIFNPNTPDTYVEKIE